jgi:putative membrane protein
MFGNYGWGMMGGWGGMLMMAAFWIVLLLAIVWVVRSVVGSSPGGSTARSILDTRYARGEITRKEYEQMKKDMES